MSAMMTDMSQSSSTRRAAKPRNISTTFTLRDLNRQPAKVLEACEAAGIVRIQTRDGRSFSLKPDPLPVARSPRVANLLERRRQLRERLRAAGYVPPSDAEMELVNRIIAGEE